MNNQIQELEQTIQTEEIKRFSWKKELVKDFAMFALFGNLIYGVVSYGWRTEGLSEEKIRSLSKIEHYDSTQQKYLPITIDPIYLMTLPGREIGLLLYNVFPSYSSKDK